MQTKTLIDHSTLCSATYFQSHQSMKSTQIPRRRQGLGSSQCLSESEWNWSIILFIWDVDTVVPWIIALGTYFFFGIVKGALNWGRALIHLKQMHGSNMQSLVKNGSRTPLHSKAFILLHVMQLRCSAGSQILHCCHRVTGQILGGLAFGLVHK